MPKKLTLHGLLACVTIVFAVAIASSCNKNEKGTQPQAIPQTSPVSKFKLNGTGDHADFYVTCASSSKVLEISGFSLLDGGTASQSTYSGNQQGFSYQKWKITDQGDGTYKFMNLGSGKYLEEVAGSTQVIQNAKNTGSSQLWYILYVAPGQYRIQNKTTGYTLTNHNNSQTNGTPVTAEASADNTSQYWNFTLIASEAYRDDDVIRFFQRTSGSEAFDEGASVPLPNGQVLWVTGDVFYNQLNTKGEFRCGQIFNYHNSMLIQPASHSWDPASTVNVLSPNGVQVFHNSNSKNLFWPGAGIQAGTKVYFHVIDVPTGTLSVANQYLAEISGNSAGTGINSIVPLTVPGMSGQTAISYSIGMVKATDGYVYAYGAGGFLGASVFVARFPQNSPTSWTFWNGSAWAATPSTASAAVVAQGPINNNTIGYANGKYIMVAMDYGFTCDQTKRSVYTSTSTSPTGPFINKKTVYQIPDMKQGHVPTFYNPTIHSEFDNGQNELLVDYCINFYNTNDGKNTKCLIDCSNADGTEDPNDYRQKAIRIPYSAIGL